MPFVGFGPAVAWGAGQPYATIDAAPTRGFAYSGVTFRPRGTGSNDGAQNGAGNGTYPLAMTDPLFPQPEDAIQAAALGANFWRYGFGAQHWRQAVGYAPTGSGIGARNLWTELDPFLDACESVGIWVQLCLMSIGVTNYKLTGGAGPYPQQLGGGDVGAFTYPSASAYPGATYTAQTKDWAENYQDGPDVLYNTGVAAGIAARQQFVDLWRSVAGRYKNREIVFAYELYNEPSLTTYGPDGNYADRKLSEHFALLDLGINAIRFMSDGTTPNDHNHMIALNEVKVGSHAVQFDTEQDNLVRPDPRPGNDLIFLTPHTYNPWNFNEFSPISGANEQSGDPAHYPTPPAVQSVAAFKTQIAPTVASAWYSTVNKCKRMGCPCVWTEWGVNESRPYKTGRTAADIKQQLLNITQAFDDLGHGGAHFQFRRNFTTRSNVFGTYPKTASVANPHDFGPADPGGTGSLDRTPRNFQGNLDAMTIWWSRNTINALPQVDADVLDLDWDTRSVVNGPSLDLVWDTIRQGLSIYQSVATAYGAAAHFPMSQRWGGYKEDIVGSADWSLFGSAPSYVASLLLGGDTAGDDAAALSSSGVGSSVDGPDAGSLTAWINPASASSGHVLRLGGYTTPIGPSVYYDAATGKLQVQNDSRVVLGTTANPIPASGVTFLAWTWSASGWLLYVNADPVLSGAQVLNVSGYGLSPHAAFGTPFNGRYDEVSLFNGVLTAPQVENLWHTGGGPYNAVDGAALDADWDLRGAVDGVSDDLVWDATSSVTGISLDLDWDMGATAVASTLTLDWDVRNPVSGLSEDLVWTLQMPEVHGAVPADPLPWLEEQLYNDPNVVAPLTGANPPLAAGVPVDWFPGQNKPAGTGPIRLNIPANSTQYVMPQAWFATGADADNWGNRDLVLAFPTATERIVNVYINGGKNIRCETGGKLVRQNDTQQVMVQILNYIGTCILEGIHVDGALTFGDAFRMFGQQPDPVQYAADGYTWTKWPRAILQNCLVTRNHGQQALISGKETHSDCFMNYGPVDSFETDRCRFETDYLGILAAGGHNFRNQNNPNVLRRTHFKGIRTGLPNELSGGGGIWFQAGTRPEAEAVAASGQFSGTALEWVVARMQSPAAWQIYEVYMEPKPDAPGAPFVGMLTPGESPIIDQGGHDTGYTLDVNGDAVYPPEMRMSGDPFKSGAPPVGSTIGPAANVGLGYVSPGYRGNETPVDGPALDLNWDMPQTVNAGALDALWDLGGVVNTAVERFVWDTAGDGVVADLTLDWDVSGAVDSAAGDLRWDVNSAVDSGAADLLWDARGAANSAAERLKWDEIAQTTAPTSSLRWDVSNPVDLGTVSLFFDVRQAQDSTPLDLVWGVASHTTPGQVAFMWDVSNPMVGPQQPFGWRLTGQSDGLMLETLWDVFGELDAGELELLWDETTPVSELVILLWTLRSQRYPPSHSGRIVDSGFGSLT